MENNHKVLLVVGGVVLVIVLLVMRRSSGSTTPTIITSGGSGSDLTPEQSRIQLAQIESGVFGKILDYSAGQTTTASAERLGSQRISASANIAAAQTANQAAQIAGQTANTAAQIAASKETSLAQTAASLQSSLGQNQLQSTRDAIMRELGLAQISASRDIAAAQNQNQLLEQQAATQRFLAGLQSQRDQQAAQNRSTAANNALSTIAQLLRALTQPQRSGGGGGASGGSGGGLPASVTRRNLNPRSPIAPAIDLSYGLPDYQYQFPTPDFYPVDFGGFDLGAPDYSNTYYPDLPILPTIQIPDTSQIDIYPIDVPGESNYDPGASDIQNFNDYGWAFEG